MLACASPEALIGPIASVTSRIKVGSGGVMLPHYSPLKVAETFSMFAGLFPDRIDLGIGRAPGSDPKTAYALQRDRRQAAPDDFPEQLVELIAYLEDRLPPDHPFRELAKLPGLPHVPEVHLLGSSPQSGIWAGGTRPSVCLRRLHQSAGRRDCRALSRGVRPVRSDSRGRAPSSRSGRSAAETDEEAERLSASHRMAMRLFLRGTLIKVPPVETALRFLAERPPAIACTRPRRRIAGSPEKVKREIEAVAAEYGAEEVMIVTITHEHAARRRSYELIAEAFGLR